MGYLVNTITGWGGQGLQGCHPRGSRGLMEYPGWSSLLENIVLLLVIVPAQSGVRSGRKPPDFYNFFVFGGFSPRAAGNKFEPMQSTKSEIFRLSFYTQGT